MAVTGLVLYIVPEGRVAYWIIWKLAGMTRTQWSDIHILSSLLFVVAGGFHIYFNWNTLMFYLHDKVAWSIRLQKELVISSLVALWIVLSAMFYLPPLSYLLDLNAHIKSAWVTKAEYEPPFGHAELLSLKIFAKKMDINLESAVTELRTSGINFENANETLEIIARKNGYSPMDIYMLIKKFEPAPPEGGPKEYTPEMVEYEFAGGNLGNRTITAICEKTGLPLETAIKRLEASGISAAGNQTMKEVAESVGSKPIEILKVILINGYSQPKPISPLDD